MQLSGHWASQSAASTAAWNPVSIQLDSAARLDEGVSGVVTMRADLRPAATSSGTWTFKAWQGGRVIDEQHLVGRVTSAERQKLQAVRDALLGSGFLASSQPVTTTTTPLLIGSMRLTVSAADGTRRAYTVRADELPSAPMQALDAALESWAMLAFPEMDGRAAQPR